VIGGDALSLTVAGATSQHLAHLVAMRFRTAQALRQERQNDVWLRQVVVALVVVVVVVVVVVEYEITTTILLLVLSM